MKLSPVLLGQWLITSQAVMQEAHSLYTHPSCMTDPLYNSDQEARLLPLIRPQCLYVTPFESNYPDCVTINEECTPQRP